MSTWRTVARWTEDDAAAALAALRQSGLSVAVFAAREGLDAQRLYVWRRRLEPRAGFVELTPPAVGDVRDVAQGFEVALRCGHVVRLSETFDANALRRLLDVLEGPC
jgi:transposase-like protein